MQRDSKLLEMLTGYAAAHQHPLNIGIHLIGIPTIMLGAFIVLSWLDILIDINDVVVSFNLAHVALLVLFLFYLTLDAIFSVAFLIYAVPIAWIATRIGMEPLAVSGTVAAIAFFGGYIAQFVGHAIEKSPPVILKHPVQANLAAPFFTVVEIFGILGLRDELFRQVQDRVAKLQQQQAA